MEKHEEKTITRREVVSLAGIAATLGTMVGATESAEGQDAMLASKVRAGSLLMKFYTVPDAAGKQTLLGSVPVPAMLQYKFQQMRGGSVQLKIETTTAGTLLPAVQKSSILAESVLQFKQSLRNLPKP
jgi:hypothetical protein